MSDETESAQKLRIHLSLGSNQGNREEYLASAIKLIALIPGIEVIAVSDMYISDAIGKDLSGYFLNCALCIDSELELFKAHHGFSEVEQILGKGTDLLSEDRTIDIDVIFAGDFKGTYNELKIPHEKYPARDFVLMPLEELGETLSMEQLDDVMRHMVRDRGDNPPLCLRYKKMVY